MYDFLEHEWLIYLTPSRRFNARGRRVQETLASVSLSPTSRVQSDENVRVLVELFELHQLDVSADDWHRSADYYQRRYI